MQNESGAGKPYPTRDCQRRVSGLPAASGAEHRLYARACRGAGPLAGSFAGYPAACRVHSDGGKVRLIKQLGEVVLEKAGRAMQHLLGERVIDSNFRVAVNISASQFLDPRFPFGSGPC